MKKLFSALLCVILLATAMASSVMAVGETMTAKKGTPVIDGEIDEIWAKADRQALSHVKAGDLKGIDPEFETTFASALWDDGYIYFLFEVTDDDVTNAFGGDPTAREWKNDTIFLYVDEENTKSESLWIDGTYQIGFCYDGTAVTPRNGGAYTKEIISAAKQTDNGFIIEVAFPPEIISLKAGMDIGVDYQYNDGTEAGTRDYCLGWSDEIDGASGNASIWGTLKLSDESAAPAAVVEEAPAPAEEVPAPSAENAEIVEKGAADIVAVPISAEIAPATSDALTITLIALAAAVVCAVAVSKKHRA